MHVEPYYKTLSRTLENITSLHVGCDHPRWLKVLRQLSSVWITILRVTSFFSIQVQDRVALTPHKIEGCQPWLLRFYRWCWRWQSPSIPATHNKVRLTSILLLLPYRNSAWDILAIAACVVARRAWNYLVNCHECITTILQRDTCADLPGETFTSKRNCARTPFTLY